MNPRIPSANSLFPLPDELSLAVLSLLSEEKDLGLILLTCRDGLRLAAVEHERRLVNDCKMAVADSSLWRYLPLLVQEDKEEVNGQRFLDYLEILIGPIPPAEIANVNTFSRFKNTVRNLPLAKRYHSNFLETKGKPIANRIMQHYHPKKDLDDLSKENNPNTLKQFMKSVSGDFSDSFLWANYSALYKSTLWAALIVKLSWTANEIEKIYVIADPIFSYFVNGRVLCDLDAILTDTIQNGLIMQMLQEAFRLYQLQNKQSADILKLEILEQALGRLAENDLVKSFSNFLRQDQRNQRRRWLTNVIQQQYPFLIEKLNEKLLLTISDLFFEKLNLLEALDYPPLTLAILTNPVLLKRLSQKRFVTLLKRLPPRDIPLALSDANVLQHLSFPVFSQWLDKLADIDFASDEEDEYDISERAEKILTHEGMLKKLASNEIIFIAKHVTYDVANVFASTNFRNRILQDENPSRLLISLCQIERHCFAHEVPKYRDTLAILSSEEILKIATLNRATAYIFLRFDTVLEKINNDQLWALVEAGGAEAVPSVVAKNLFSRFSDSNLEKFFYKWTFSSKVSVSDSKVILKENLKRSPPEFFVKTEAAKEESINLANTATYSKATPPVKKRQENFIATKPAVDSKNKQKSLSPLNKSRLQKKKRKKENNLILQLVLYTLFALVGIAFITTGIGGLIGVPLLAKAGALLFSWTLTNPAIVSLGIGIGIECMSAVQTIRTAIQLVALEKDYHSQVYKTYPKPPPELLSKPSPAPMKQSSQGKPIISKTPGQPNKKSALANHSILKDSSPTGSSQVTEKNPYELMMMTRRRRGAGL